jgi:hypothetical protein
MADQESRPRLIAVLWFVAAALAFIAAIIPALGDGSPNWGVAVPGLFCLFMGVTKWIQKPGSPPTR